MVGCARVDSTDFRFDKVLNWYREAKQVDIFEKLADDLRGKSLEETLIKDNYIFQRERIINYK